MEAFVTPIILSYVQKYVNLRPQDAQLSLWEGDAVFQNLDLRLDVLQREFQLPFEILSGHIHELIIHIPWTKITSEPISITINTIEFVLKLKELDAAAAPKSEKSKSSQQIEDTSKGYINSLVDKIVKNISITCNNIILKYVEEDIVVSMNIQLLSFCSADNEWKPAFIDVGPTKVVLRRLMQVSDLTICLDKRNSSGQIDVSEEPILYKCSLETRIVLRYNSNLQQSTTTTIEVFTNSLELNISSQQFPMVMRLVFLALSLKSGKLPQKNEESAKAEKSDNTELLGSDSMLSWAWSKVPSIFPPEDSEESAEAFTGSFMKMGVYIANLKITLKSLEIFADSIVQNSRKIRYNPIMRISLNGNYFESHVQGFKWFDARAGVSQAFVEPLGSFSGRSQSNNFVVFASDPLTNTYLQGSLFDFDGDAKAESEPSRLMFDYDTHIREVNETYLSMRSPAAGFDMLHFLDIPDSHAFDAELDRSLEYSDLPEKTIMRIYLSGLTLKYNSAVTKIVDVLKEMIKSYDYPPYVEETAEENPAKLPPPLMDDFDALMNNIPRKTMIVKVNNFRLEMHPLNHSPEKTLSKHSYKKSVNENLIPFIAVCIKNLQLENIAPLYENRLVHTTCQLPDKPKELLDASYTTYFVSASNCSLLLLSKASESNIMEIPEISAQVGCILKEACWGDDIKQIYGSSKMTDVRITFSRPQEIILLRISRCLFTYDRKALLELVKSSAIDDLAKKDLALLETKVMKARANFVRFRHALASDGSVGSVKMFLIDREKDARKLENLLIFEAPKNEQTTREFIIWKLQLPGDTLPTVHPRIVLVNVQKSKLIVHPSLESMLLYEESMTEVSQADIMQPTLEHRVSHISVTSERLSKKTIQPDETIHVSSDKDDKNDSLKNKGSLEARNNGSGFDTLANLSDLVFALEMDQCEILFPNDSGSESDIVTQEVFNKNHYILVKFPSIKCKSTNTPVKFDTELPIKLDDKSLNASKSGFSWNFELSELYAIVSEKGVQKYILMPIKTIITMAFDSKDALDVSSFRMNLHLDTAPIICNLYENQIIFITRSVALLTALQNLFIFEKNAQESSVKHSKTSPCDDDLDIKEFLAINSNSEFSHEVLSTVSKSESVSKEMKEKSTTSIWLQWTFTKITLNIYMERSTVQSKLALEMEDFITSVDKENVYFKLKSKIGALSVRYFYFNEESDWILSGDLRVAVQLQTNENERQNAFLDLTLTIAEVQNVFKKWGTHTKSEVLNTLSEIVLNLKAIEFQLSVKGIEDLLPLMDLFSTDQNKNIPKPKGQSVNSEVTSVANLPLIHFDCKGLVFYVPAKNPRDNCDVLILRVGHIKIRPNAENPLTRIPIRPDVYTKAEQLRILHTPGSRIEDRQYELIISNISAVTSTWSEMLLLIKENENVYNTNPAVEWNNLDKKPAITIDEIFKNFVISVIYAPCVMYKTTLICGQSIELNCVTDLIFDVTIAQLLLINDISKAFIASNCNPPEMDIETVGSNQSIVQSNKYNKDDITESDQRHEAGSIARSHHITPLTNYNSLIRINRTRKGERPAKITYIPSENINTDSGFASAEKACTKRATYENGAIPYDISLVAGEFYFKVHDTAPNRANVTSEQTAVEPLASLKITQPSMLITKKIHDYTIKYSIFSLILKLGSNGKQDVSEMLFETKTGCVNSTGIIPPLISVTYTYTVTNKIDVKFKIGRPVKIHICENAMKLMCNMKQRLSPILEKTDECEKADYYKPIVRGTTIRKIRNVLFNADSVNVSLEQLQIECIDHKEYGLKAGMAKSSLQIEHVNHPESLHSKLKVQALYIQTASHVMLHPLSIKCDLSLKQELWNKFPIVHFKMETNVLHLDINPKHLLRVTVMQKNFIDAMNECFAESSLHKANEIQPAAEGHTNLKDIPLPNIPIKEEVEHKNEYFQDDLRAGAFQIVEETSSRSSLPLPYQMRISFNEKAICWRYPQPRCITKLLLYPILVEASKLAAIQCTLEYYNDVLDEFSPYFHFTLSDRETQTLKVPEIKVAAYIWRISVSQKQMSTQLDCIEEISADEAERLEDENAETVSINDFLKMDDLKVQGDLNLKTLIGCIRVDSSFQPDKIPILQALLRIPYIQINLQNEFGTENLKCPPPIQHFRISDDFYKRQTFASIILSKINIHTLQKKKENYATNFDMTIACRVLDYSFLKMLDLLEPTHMKGFILYDEKIDCNIVVDVMRFNFGPGIMHALLSSKHLWIQILNNQHTYIPLISRYIICNVTNLPFQFGQTNSDELILVQPNECSFYAFRSDHLKNSLTFVFEKNSNRESCILEVTNEGTRYLEMKSCVLIATFEKLSSTQVCIFIKGQLEVLSMSKELFQVQHFANDTKGYCELGVGGHGSFVGNYKEDNHRIRLKLVNGKGWSGEIPLISKSIPWLVKLPASTPQDFISFWVRIIEEKINTVSDNDLNQKRILVLIWPMFIVKSFLPTNTVITDIGSGSTYVSKGHGSTVELQISGDNNSGHEIRFEGLTFSSEDNDANILLTYKGIDRNRFFEIENRQLSIDAYLSTLKQPQEESWSFSSYEYQQTLGTTSAEQGIKCINRIVPSRKFSSGIMLEIMPWCMFLNSTGKRLKIAEPATNNSVIIESNKLCVLPVIKDAFKIELCCGTHWADSWPIYINESSFKRTATRNKLLLPDKGTIVICIYHAFSITRFVLTSSFENNARILKLASGFAIVNLSNILLDVLPFAFDEGSRISEKEIFEILNKSRFQISPTDLGVKPAAVPIDVFIDATGSSLPRATQASLKHYICITVNKSDEISLPMQFSKPFNRKCLNIFNNNESIPLAACVVERDNQFVMSIFNDKCPKFEIQNFTDLTFFVAGTKSADSEKSSKIMAELNEKGFEWFQRLNANTRVFYTPPELYSNFPDAEYAHCNLAFALCLKSHSQSNAKNNLRWSKPLRTESNRETLLNIPFHGDVKILVCNNHKTTKIYIFYITQGMEFSVKELRTRLSDPRKSMIISQDSMNRSEISILQELNKDSKDILDISCSSCSAQKPRRNIPNVNFFVKEASVSIFLDSKQQAGLKQDILSIYLDEIGVKFDRKKRLLSFIVSNAQLDNQLYISGKYDFPVLFCAEKQYSRTTELPCCLDLEDYLDKLKLHALLELRARFYEDNLDLEKLNCKVSAARAYIEDTYLNDLLDHFLDCDPSNAVYIYEDIPEESKILDGRICIPNRSIDQALYLSGAIQLKLVKIEPINLMLSVHTCVRLYIALDHSPLHFSEFERRHVLTLPVKFGNAIGLHYLSGAIFGAGWVVGSLEILGSPGGLARSVSTGLKDFVSLPVQGLSRGPWGFLAGITQGSASLLKNVTAGTVNSVTKLAASVARNLDRLTLDDEHLQRTEALRRLRPQGFTEGITQGLTGLGISLLGALGGLARHPLEARSSVEVMTGVAKGIVGAFTKPLSGAAELLALTGQGMLHTVGFNTMPQQRNAQLSKNVITGPADCKLPWKYLPRHSKLTAEQLLFYHDATIVESDQFKRAIIALVGFSFVILKYSEDCPAEIFPIERTEMTVDADDRTLVEVRVLQMDEYNEEADCEFFNNRLISFLRDSSDNLQTTSVSSFDDLLVKSSSAEKKYKFKRQFYMNEFLVSHLVCYFNVLKNCSELFRAPSHS